MNFARLTWIASAAFAVQLALANPSHATQLGLQAGFVSSNYSVTPATTLDSKKALTFGAALELDLAGPFTIEPGLNYVPKGFVLGTYNQASYYLSIPVLLKFKAPGPVAVFAAIGPEFSIELGNYYSVVGAATLTKSTDFGLHAAGGVEFGLLPGITNYLKVAYSLGLTNVSDSAGSEAKTKALMITLGFVLPI